MHFAEQVALAKHVVLSAIQANSGRTTKKTEPVTPPYSLKSGYLTYSQM
jgi:hypothetical protein